MPPSASTSFQSDVYENTPNESLINIMYSTMFGNGSFQIQPPSIGEVGAGFPSYPYLSLEAVIFQQQSSNPQRAPYTLLSGSNTGQQVIGGQITQSDANGLGRYFQGLQAAAG